MQKITTFLTFNDQAEEAANFYVSLFKNSRITNVTHYGDALPEMKGKVMSVSFQLEGQDFMALNGGSQFKFSSGISLFVNCQSQAEVDELWAKLTEGGEEEPCGWLKDRYGVSWQIIPAALSELLQEKDAEKARRVVSDLLQMKKIDINRLQQAKG
ncbi:MAG: VOC family protein [Acidobacteriota bacterium]